MSSIEESLNDLKIKKEKLENSNEKLEEKVKDLKATLTEYETANQQLDSKLLWAEKTYEEGINKMMTEYRNKEQMILKQNEELLEKTHNERLERENKIKSEMKQKITEIQKGIEASNQEIKKLRDDKQQLLEENMKLTQMLSEVTKSNDDAKQKEIIKCYECRNCNSTSISKYLDLDHDYEVKEKLKENEELKTKNGKLEKHLDSLKVQVSDLKTELLELKFRKNNKMSKVKDETEKYKEYFKSQIEALRNEMISKKNNMDKMKLLLDEYKNKIIELEKELSEINQRWDKKWEEERNKEKLYILEIENKLGKEISQLRKEKSKKAQQLSDMSIEHDKLSAKTKIKRNNFVDFLQSIQKEFDSLDKWNQDYEELYADILAESSQEKDSIKLLINVVDHMKHIMSTVHSRIERYTNISFKKLFLNSCTFQKFKQAISLS